MKKYKKEDVANVIERFRLDGRKALVAGAGRGIGRAYALGLAEAGADVAVVARSRETAEQTAADVSARGRRAIAIQADVTCAEDVNRMVETVIREWGSLDIGVNNVGGASLGNAVDCTEAEWDAAIAFSLKSVFFCAQAEARVMLPRKYGSIINTSSISGFIVNRPPVHATYSIAKAGIIQLTRVLAVEWVTSGIRVNAISPGLIYTPAADLPEFLPARAVLIKNTPMARIGRVEDLQGAVVFLASDVSGFMTGQNLIIDGGYTLW